MDTLALFDYGTLDLDTRSFVQTKTAEIRILVKQTAQGIIEIGQRLIDVKEKLGHGNWLPWLKTELDWSQHTANNFMRVAERFKLVPERKPQLFITTYEVFIEKGPKIRH